MRVRPLIGAFATLLLLLSPGPRAAADPVDPVVLEGILDHASVYVFNFVRKMEHVVSQEDYVQDTQRLASGPAIGMVRHRELKSDLLLVKLPESLNWLPFRDVYEVDGEAIRQRDDRLKALFMNPSDTALDQAKKISAESARYNIGAVDRTINNPMMALVFLQREYRNHFEFTLGDLERRVAPDAWVIEYRETARPTLVRGANNMDLPAHGRFWVDGRTGRVLKSELEFEDADIRAAITTTFKQDKDLGLDVPDQMDERYTLRASQVLGHATYSHFRAFTVSANATLAPEPHVVTDPVAGLKLVEVPAGSFTMGSGFDDPQRRTDETPHEVVIDHRFYLGQAEVTQAEWKAVMGDNPSRFSNCGPNCPVENVTYDEVQQFLATLNVRHGEYAYRLPTEAEWEYACRAGGALPFSTGSILTTSQANYNGLLSFTPTGPGLYRGHPTPAGTFHPNAWGLEDMEGNVLEWTSDWYGRYPTAPETDPTGPQTGARRVTRGGSWFLDVGSARCATRGSEQPADGDFQLGFRVAAEHR
jgi:formylglycine-generating enzyme required for sulfatase activity